MEVHEILQSNATSDRVEMDFSSCVEYNWNSLQFMTLIVKYVMWQNYKFGLPELAVKSTYLHSSINAFLHGRRSKVKG